MSTLRSAIDQLASIDLSSLSDAALDEELVEQARAVDLLQSQLLRVTAEVDRRRYFEIDGVLSTARYLAVACGMSNTAARQQVALARALEEMPLAAAALASGDLPLARFDSWPRQPPLIPTPTGTTRRPWSRWPADSRCASCTTPSTTGARRRRGRST